MWWSSRTCFVREVLVAALETVPASARDAVLARAARTGARDVLEVAARRAVEQGLL